MQRRRRLRLLARHRRRDRRPGRFAALKQHCGGPGASRAQGDFDGDGDVDLDEFAALKTHFGLTSRP
ncbi:MAG: hypothetical protein ACOC7R_01115 [Planctomycetota bacterium]